MVRYRCVWYSITTNTIYVGTVYVPIHNVPTRGLLIAAGHEQRLVAQACKIVPPAEVTCAVEEQIVR